MSDKRKLQVASYSLKQGTATSYYLEDSNAVWPLPRRLSISSNDMTHVVRAGRMNYRKSVGQLIGGFTREETSPLKAYKPFKLRTQLWEVDEHPGLAYGTTGITNLQGKISDTGDLVLLYNVDERTIKIYFVEGAGTPDGLAEVLKLIDEGKRTSQPTPLRI